MGHPVNLTMNECLLNKMSDLEMVFFLTFLSCTLLEVTVLECIIHINLPEEILSKIVNFFKSKWLCIRFINSLQNFRKILIHQRWPQFYKNFALRELKKVSFNVSGANLIKSRWYKYRLLPLKGLKSVFETFRNLL